MHEELSKYERKAWAKLLYTKHDVSLKDIALEVNVDEATLRNWIAEGAWSGIKKSLRISRTVQLERLYDFLDAHHNRMSSVDEISVKDVDLSIKYTAAIRNLDAEPPMSDILDVADMFVRWLRRRNPELTKEITVYLDTFIKEHMPPS